jgi:transposase
MEEREAIPRDSTDARQRIEVITGHERRRNYGDAEKARLVAEASQPGCSVQEIARRHGVCPSLLYRWRRHGPGGRAPEPLLPRLIPVRVGGEPASPPPDLGVRVTTPLVEITLPNGYTVRVDQHVDGKALRRIIAALRG